MKLFALYFLIVVLIIAILILFINPTSWWLYLLITITGFWLGTILGGISDPKGDS